MKEAKPSPPPAQRRQPGFFWLVLLPLALLAGIFIAIRRQPAPPTVPAGTPGRPNPVATAMPVAPGAVRTWILVPDANATLKRMSVPAPLAGSTSAQSRMTAAVRLLLRAAPGYYPPGAALLGPVKLSGDVAELNFNAKFAEPTFWPGSTRTTTTIYSIVNTVVANADPKAASPTRRVRFLVEGKPVEVLGEFDTTDPVEPKLDMVAKG